MPKRKSAVAASTPSSTKKQKREIVTAAKVTATDDTTPRASSSNRPRRVASTHTAPKQSKYFERSEEEESGDEASESGYEDENGVESQQSDNNTEEDDYDSDEEERKPAKRSRKLNLKKDAVAEVLEGKNDLWREGVKTGLGPGHQVFIAKPKARGDGGIPYMPEKIHPHTMEFLKDLKKNNDRVWFKAHDADYRASWKDFGSFVETLTEKIAEVDETIPELPPKDLVFRIYRDSARIKSVLTSPGMRKHIFGGISKDTKKAIQAFCDQNKANALKTKPKGYEADNPNIDLLRLRNFTIGANISDDVVIGPGGLDRIMELVSIMQPFVSYLNSVVMPDDEAADGSDDTSDEDNASSE